MALAARSADAALVTSKKENESVMSSACSVVYRNDFRLSAVRMYNSWASASGR